MSQEVARRFGIAYVVLWCQLLLGVAMLAEILRLFPAQFAFAIGLVITDGQNAPERVQLLLHLAGYTALAATMWMWWRGDSRTWLMMKVTAGWQLLIAPAGLAVAGLLWWLSRHPEREEASRQMPIIAGNRRTVILVTWIAANAVTFIVGVGAFYLLQVPPLWFVAMLASSLPMFGAFLWLCRPSVQNEQATVMPALPELIQS